MTDTLLPLETLPQCFSSPELLYGDYAVLKDLTKVLAKFQVDWWLDSGSLIGALRHNSFIPFDDDIDLCMDYLEFYKILPELKKEFQKRGYQLRPGKNGKATETRNGRVYPAYYQFFLTKARFTEIMKEFYGTKAISPQKINELWKKPQPYGDFLLTETLPDDRIQYLGNYFKNEPYVKSMIYPVKPYKNILGLTVLIPRKTVQYLKNNYRSAVSPVTNAIVWNEHTPVNHPVCNQKLKVDMLNENTLNFMNNYLGSIFGNKLKKTTTKSLLKYQ